MPQDNECGNKSQCKYRDCLWSIIDAFRNNPSATREDMLGHISASLHAAGIPEDDYRSRESDESTMV